MNKSGGAFYEAVKFCVEEDFKIKKLIVQEIIDNPNKYLTLTNSELLEIIFSDYQNFVNKFKNT